MKPDEAYLMSLRDLANVESSLVEAQVVIDGLSAERIESIPSELNITDYVCPIIFGVCGGLVSTSPMLRGRLDKIHTHAAQPKPKTAMGKILAHRGDHTGKAKVGEELYQFVKRDGSRVGAQGIHRLFYGHDPFSIGADNPFIVLSNQYGLVRGIVQALRHLLADTFSKQGLPIPFHSFLDYSNSGNLDNWLGTWASQLKGNSGMNQMEAFGHIGTIRMQDFMSQGLTWALCKI